MASVTMRSSHCQRVGGPPRIPPLLEARMRLVGIWKDLPVSRRTRNCLLACSRGHPLFLYCF
jgi:hypothetical protein